MTVKEVRVYIPVEFQALITSITRYINFFMKKSGKTVDFAVFYGILLYFIRI